ncbi:BTB/POZ domain-containing protein At1g55760-like isoform X2 [Andrographis paniculata]|uniref:BTB/POZ domain-containing protein At1g55760-like isoform X2 n=1 Tax=Andrographis paniculata TaxID=175694 RepID=UPI0021E75EEC|nr:BTB/POZ domain-containing protein At1g55760-like isoform X2 [Andrographis paniculata]
MSCCAYRVDTTSRLAQWRIENLASFAYRKSDPFRIGKWNWHLSVEKSRSLIIKLYPEISKSTRDNPPIASFVIKVVSSTEDRKCLIHPVVDKLLKCNEDFAWPIEIPLTKNFIIDVEFLDLKTSSLQGNEVCSIWGEGSSERQSNQTALTLLGRMLSEGIHTDILINASDGSIAAHRAVLASRSPVFRGMFSHNLMENELSAVDIPDMSIEACQAFLSYIYGNIRNDTFLMHRLALVRAADKYDVSDLKEACQESLIEDIDNGNALERLQYAALYHLPRLKISCTTYLVKFAKIFDVRDEFNTFLQCGDRELVAEVFNEVLDAWRGF